MSSRVASIIGQDPSGNIYGVARNKKTYLKYDAVLKSWISIQKSDLDKAYPIKNTHYTVPDGATAAVAGTTTISGDHWGGEVHSYF